MRFMTAILTVSLGMLARVCRLAGSPTSEVTRN